MNVRDELRTIVAAAIKQATGDEAPENIVIDVPKVKDHGDYATNVAMLLAKKLRRKPLDIAEEVAQKIPPGGLVAKVEIKAPGFINFFVSDSSVAAGLARIIAQEDQYGRSKKFAGKRAIVEFVSANPTGPLHIGHARNAAVGDCIARALEWVGYDVWREYYYNDGGAQIQRLGESTRSRYLQIFDEKVPFPDDGYHGDYIKEIAAEIHAANGELWRDKSIMEFARYAQDWVVKLIDADMSAMGIRFNEKFNEASLYEDGRVDKVLQRLKESDSAYENEGALWLRTTQFGDEKDRVLVKKDGEKTYLSPDIAYHEYKYSRGFDLLVNLLGADHHNYVVRLRAAMQALGYDPEKLNCIIYQLVTVKRGGEIVKFGKRAGDYITVHEMLEEIGNDAVRFFFNMRRGDSHMVFDWDLAREHSVKNPVYYIQYAHARCCSIERKAAEQGIEFPGSEAVNWSLLNSPEEQDLIRTLYEYPRIVEVAGCALEPHHYTAYLRDVAEQFNAYFTVGNVNEEMRVILPNNPPLAQARLGLILATRVVLRNALSALGISAPGKM